MTRLLQIWPRGPSVAPKRGMAQYVAVRLSDKCVLRVRGPQSLVYLQSLLSNDVRRVTDSASATQSAIYSYLLSAVGRVLSDVFVFGGRSGEFLLEVDRTLASAIKRLLVAYHVHGKVEVESGAEWSVWSLLPSASPPALAGIDREDFRLVEDPRVGPSHLGYRLLSRLGGDTLPEVRSELGGICVREGTLSDYTRRKYRLGIGEGHRDILSAHYSPAELNADFLKAISLSKGLYTAEARMARLYSRSAITRRVMPVRFLCPATLLRQLEPCPRTLLADQRGKTVGELVARSGLLGLALLPVPHTAGPYGPLTHPDSGLRLEASVPEWWPPDYLSPQLEAPDYPRSLFNLWKEEANRVRQ